MQTTVKFNGSLKTLLSVDDGWVLTFGMPRRIFCQIHKIVSPRNDLVVVYKDTAHRNFIVFIQRLLRLIKSVRHEFFHFKIKKRNSLLVYQQLKQPAPCGKQKNRRSSEIVKIDIMEKASKTPQVPSTISPPTELPSFLKNKQTEPEAEKSEKRESPTDTKEKDGEHSDQSSQHPEPAIAAALTPITEGMKNTVLYSWMKDSFSQSIEIAKTSVRSVVTVLDPQMGQLLNSGGDIEIIVASTNEDKIDPVRESFQDVFRKATVYGKKGSESTTIAAQPIGFESAELSAKERINALRSNEALVDKTILSIENFLVEVYKNQWFDVGLLLLSDVRNNVTIKTFTQFTSVPLDIVKSIEAETPTEYDKQATGLAVPIGLAMSKFLNVPHYEWHYKYTGTARYDMIMYAAKSLASIYKRELQTKATSAIAEEK
jgi:non-canonical (house-cleaning) NTP pyrophosphatase